MSNKKTMTLNLSGKEMAVLEELAAKKDLSKVALVQTLDARVQPGKKLLVEDEATKEKSELVIL